MNFSYCGLVRLYQFPLTTWFKFRLPQGLNLHKVVTGSFQGGAVIKNPPANAGRTVQVDESLTDLHLESTSENLSTLENFTSSSFFSSDSQSLDWHLNWSFHFQIIFLCASDLVHTPLLRRFYIVASWSNSPSVRCQRYLPSTCKPWLQHTFLTHLFPGVNSKREELADPNSAAAAKASSSKRCRGPFTVSCVCVSRSVMSNSLRPQELQPTNLLCPWGFSRQEYQSGLPFPSPGDLPKPGTQLRSPALQADFLPSEPPGKPHDTVSYYHKKRRLSMLSFASEKF